MNVGLMLAGLTVGLLVGLTGMGAGSLMTPILITFFGIPASTAVGTDLVYAAVTKMFGAARHTQLKNVNRELALWMATGSVPAAFLGTYALYNLFGGNVNTWLPNVIGYTLIAVGIAVAIRTFVTIRGLWDHHEAAHRRRADHEPQGARGHDRRRVRVHPRAHLGRLGRVLRHGPRHPVPALGPARRRHRPLPRDDGDPRRRRRHDHLGHPRTSATSARS